MQESRRDSVNDVGSSSNAKINSSQKYIRREKKEKNFKFAFMKTIDISLMVGNLDSLHEVFCSNLIATNVSKNEDS